MRVFRWEKGVQSYENTLGTEKYCNLLYFFAYLALSYVRLQAIDSKKSYHFFFFIPQVYFSVTHSGLSKLWLKE